MRILKINSLPSVKESYWLDKDLIMIHSCFQLLVDFVEQECGLEHCSYIAHKESVDELKYLYDWWKENQNMEEYNGKVADEHLMRLIKIRGFLWT